MKHTNAVGAAVHVSAPGLQMMRWNGQSEPSGTLGATAALHISQKQQFSTAVIFRLELLA